MAILKSALALTISLLAFEVAVAQQTKYDIAFDLYETGDLERSKFILNDIEESYSEDARYYLLRGSVYSELGDNVLAVEDFIKSIELDPNSAEAYFQRGFAYFSVGKYNLALEDFNAVLALDPDYVEAYVNRGTVYYSLEDKENACKDWKKAIDAGASIGQLLYDQMCQ